MSPQKRVRVENFVSVCLSPRERKEIHEYHHNFGGDRDYVYRARNGRKRRLGRHFNLRRPSPNRKHYAQVLELVYLAPLEPRS